MGSDKHLRCQHDNVSNSSDVIHPARNFGAKPQNTKTCQNQDNSWLLNVTNNEHEKSECMHQWKGKLDCKTYALLVH